MLSVLTHPEPDASSNSNFETLSSDSSLGPSGVLSAPTLPEIDDIHAHHCHIKHKKVDKVNTAHILPDGLL